jgi:tetratricopeptide (TPR) repeat protein
MELVRGPSMTDYCDQHNLPVRERLELFVDVCQAVQHAHQKGIIHRDIKPSNVLVTLHDGKPVVKVIDFGIAKAMGQQLTEKTLFTNFAQMIGTPLYMSPEQAEMSGLDVDTRSDIYSLGVLLYELLTGTTPFDKERLKQAGFDEIRRIIREEEPPKPSTRMSTVGQAATTASEKRQSDPRRLSRLFQGELDWVVMKCLEKDRNRRYDTVSALVADAQRYLNDEPVQACPPTAGYRLRKFLRRNKRTVVSAAVLGTVMLTAVAALAGSTLVIWRERQEALRQRDEAERQRRLAYQAIDELYTQVVDKWSGEVRNEALQKVFFQKALPIYEQLAQREDPDPAERLGAAKAWRRVGEIHEKLGQPERAEPAYGEAIARFEKLIASFPDLPQYRLELAGSYIDLGNLLRAARRFQEAEKAYHQALALMENLLANRPGLAEDNQTAVVNLGALAMKEQIVTQRIENRRKAFDEYLYERAGSPSQPDPRQGTLPEQEEPSRNPPQTDILSGKALNDLLVQIRKRQRQGWQAPAVPLDEHQFKQINVTTGQGSIALLKNGGCLNWPSALKRPQFAAERERLAALARKAFEQASGRHRLEAGIIVQMRKDLGELHDGLKRIINDLSPLEYIEAKRFLAHFDNALKALEQPDVGRYFTDQYVLKGKTVAELVDHLVERGLLIAPAVAGDESAYQALQKGLAEYYFALAAPEKP